MSSVATSVVVMSFIERTGMTSSFTVTLPVFLLVTSTFSLRVLFSVTEISPFSSSRPLADLVETLKLSAT